MATSKVIQKKDDVILTNVNKNDVKYIIHDAMILLTSDRGGLWVQGIANRGFYELVPPTQSVSATEETNNCIKFTSPSGGGTQLMMVTRGNVEISSSPPS